jgi:hypothetical protein
MNCGDCGKTHGLVAGNLRRECTHGSRKKLKLYDGARGYAKDERFFRSRERPMPANASFFYDPISPQSETFKPKFTHIRSRCSMLFKIATMAAAFCVCVCEKFPCSLHYDAVLF